MPKYHANVCGVRVATWGTDVHAGNGMPHFLNQELFGGSTGHVAITVTFPADEKGKALIKQYCTDPPIPYEKHVIRVPKAKKGVDPTKPQSYGPSDEMMVEEEVYVVNFSWWPDWDGAGWRLAPYENEDNADEREGVHAEYQPLWQELLQPEERVHKGLLGTTKMVYGYSTVVHERGLAAKQIELLDAQAELQRVQQQIESLEILSDKLEAKRDRLRELSTRKRKMEKKDKLVDSKRAKVNALLALKNALQRKQDPTKVLSATEQAILSKLLPKWQEKQDLSKIDKKIKHNKKDLKVLIEDSLDKVSKDREATARFSTSEILLLNRFIPDWQEYDNSPAAIRKLLKKLVRGSEKKLNALRTKETELESNIKLIENILSPQGVLDFNADNQKIVKKRQLEQLATFFSDLRVNKKGHVTLDENVIAKLDLFTKLCGVAWKDNIVKPHKRKYRYLRKEEITLLKTTLETQLAGLKNVGYRANAGKDYEDIKNKRIYSVWQSIYKKLNLLIDVRSPMCLSAGESTEIKKSWQEILDNAFWLINTPWHGPNGFVKDRNHITQAEAAALFSFVRAEMAKAKYKMIDQEQSLGRFNQADFTHFLTRGHSPDVEVRLPIDNESNASNSHSAGMNVEAMLKEIQRITREEKFSLHENNCSTTASKVLQAGASHNPYLQSQFEDRALGAIANPQMVINNAMKYQAAMKSPKDNWFKRLQRFNPIERLGGWCLNKLVVEKKVSVPTKIAAGLLACVAWPYAAVKTFVTKLANPLKSFNELRRFATYANATSSLGFKIGAACAYVPPMVLLAPVAAVQYGIEKAVKGVGRLFSKITGQKQQVKPPTFFDLSPEQLKEHEHKQRLFNQATQEVLSRLDITEIAAATTSEVIAQFEKRALEATIAYARNEFKDNHYPMVTLSREAAVLLENEIEAKRKSNNSNEIAIAAELEKKYRSFQNSNTFFMTMLNTLVQNKYAEKLGQSLNEQPVDAALINKAAEQARLDFLKDINATTPANENGDQGMRRQRMRQAAFAQFADDKARQDSEVVNEPQPPKPSGPKSNSGFS